MVERINISGLLLLFLFICFAGGIVLGNRLAYFPIFLIAFLVFFIAAYIFYRRNKLFLSDILILLCFFSLGALWQISSASGAIDKFLNKESSIIFEVASLPQEQDLSNTFFGQIKKINNQPLKLKVKIIDYTKSLKYRNLYQLNAKLTKRKYNNLWFYYLRIKANTKSNQLPLTFWGKLMKKSSDQILKVFRKNCSNQSYRFLSAIFLGRRELLKKENIFFVNAGMSHLLAISGLHLGLTSLFLLFVFRLFSIKFKPALCLSLIFLYFYTFLSGASPATLRAAIMYSLFALSFLVKRKIDTFNSLALAGFAILIMNPAAIFDLGFQLSFGSVFAIILGFRVFKSKSMENSGFDYLKQVIFCSFLVTLFITPLISYYFGKVYLLTIFYNIILIPLFTFILTVNFLLIIFSPFAFIAQSLGEILSLLISVFIKIIAILSSLRFSFIFYRFSPKIVFIYYFILSLILIFLFLRQEKLLWRSSA